MVLRYMPNSGHGGPHMSRVMIFLCFCVSRQLPNIEKIQIYRSINPGRYLIFFLIKFPVECHWNHVWGAIFQLEKPPDSLRGGVGARA